MRGIHCRPQDVRPRPRVVVPPRDTLAPDSTVIRDSIRRDSIRRDSIRRDTVRRDTVRRDTTLSPRLP